MSAHEIKNPEIKEPLGPLCDRRWGHCVLIKREDHPREKKEKKLPGFIDHDVRGWRL